MWKQGSVLEDVWNEWQRHNRVSSACRQGSPPGILCVVSELPYTSPFGPCENGQLLPALSVWLNPLQYQFFRGNKLAPRNLAAPNSAEDSHALQKEMTGGVHG